LGLFLRKRKRPFLQAGRRKMGRKREENTMTLAECHEKSIIAERKTKEKCCKQKAAELYLKKSSHEKNKISAKIREKKDRFMLNTT
jgi:hypothetical protein